MLALLSSNRFLEHEPPAGHPERPGRAEVMRTVAERWRARGVRVDEPGPCARDLLERVHEAAYLDRIADTAGRSVALDPDTFTSSRSHEVALLAAGAGTGAVDAVLNEATDVTRVYALVRPPGHHAERDRAMGFCLYNTVAVAAAHARAEGVERVAVVDYDVHHGNGTQWIFYDDPQVLYVSTHQYPFYPGTGAAHQVGRGPGLGRTINVPLAAGAQDADFAEAFATVIVPILDQFQPGLLLVSAGFDAHARDPLAGMKMSAQGFGRLTADLCGVADRWSEGRMVLVTEGGYDLEALSECLDVTIGVAAGERAPEGAFHLTGGSLHGGVSSVGSTRFHEALPGILAAQRPYWQL